MGALSARLTVILTALILLSACSTRHIQDSFDGSTAQRLVTRSIDDLMVQLPTEQFEALKDQSIYIETHFVKDSNIKQYADERLKLELKNRFNINVANDVTPGIKVLSVFYTSLATDQDTFGISIPFGYVPGIDESTRLNILALEKFHGISEMYYFIGEVGEQVRSQTLQAVVKTDALGLPFITIPISNLERSD